MPALQGGISLGCRPRGLRRGQLAALPLHTSRQSHSAHLQQRLAAACSSSSSPDASTADAASSSEEEDVTFSYHSEGRLKATIEDAFGGLKTQRDQRGTAPWHMSWQMNERNLVWSDTLGARLVQKIAAVETGLSEAEMQDRVASLVTLLPDIQSRVPFMKVSLLAALVMDVDRVAAQLLVLKTIFPSANCSLLLTRELALLGESRESIAARADQLRALLPRMNIDTLVETHPSVLAIDSFKKAIEDAHRLIPNINLERVLQVDPDFVLSLQKGSDMIPYDALPATRWGHR